MSGGRSTGGDRDPAQAEFVRRATALLPSSYRLAAHLLGDPNEAEDAMQEALLSAWRGWPRLREPELFEPWLERIVVNTCFERLRRRRRSPVVALPEEELEPSASVDESAGPVARDTIGRALGVLSAEQRVVVVLRYWRDLSIEEIAVRVGIPAGTVRSRLHYALRALRSEIERPPSRGVTGAPRAPAPPRARR